MTTPLEPLPPANAVGDSEAPRAVVATVAHETAADDLAIFQQTSAVIEVAKAIEHEPKIPPEPIQVASLVRLVIEQPDDPEQLGQSEGIPLGPPPLTLEDVLRSMYSSYPLLRIAIEQRNIAAGELLAAQGEFDLKLKGGGTSGPLGFYETHRVGTGFEQALFGGGQAFAGYRVGRGNFQPWYGERETNDGGELKAGFQIPLLQNRRIDPRRAKIFRAALGRDAVEPDILLQLIDFTRAASHAYWDWVAAGQDLQISNALLEIALRRQDGLQRRVERGDLPRIELTDNERLIVSRRTTLIDAERKLAQATIKLSLFFRTPEGRPFSVESIRLPTDFPVAQTYDNEQLATDIQAALTSRPEIQFLDLMREQFEVDLAQARNLYLPEMDVGMTGSQDVGGASSKKRDKSPFELEATVVVSVPLQRRKALGKLRATEAKLNQVRNKTLFASDKISTDVQNAVAALTAAHRRIEQSRQNVRLSIMMEEAERNRFDQGDSNLLLVNLREQATADARKGLVLVLLEYFKADADYRASMADVPLLDL